MKQTYRLDLAFATSPFEDGDDTARGDLEGALITWVQERWGESDPVFEHNAVTSVELKRVVLNTIELRQSTDELKLDLEVVCTECGHVFCDAEAGDTLDVLLNLTADHVCHEGDEYDDHHPKD